MWSGQWAVLLNIKSALSHSNSKETELLPSLQVERQSIPVQDLAFQSVNSPKDIYENNKSHLASLPRDGHNSVPISRQCCDIGRLKYSFKDRWTESSTSDKETRLHTEP